MEKEKVLNYLKNTYPDSFVFDGLEDAIVGIDIDGRVAYSYSKCCKVFVAGGMTHEEAIDWMEYNVVRTIPYLGDKKPIILYDFEFLNL